jgi:hypothetical protein
MLAAKSTKDSHIVTKIVQLLIAAKANASSQDKVRTRYQPVLNWFDVTGWRHSADTRRAEWSRRGDPGSRDARGGGAWGPEQGQRCLFIFRDVFWVNHHEYFRKKSTTLRQR